MEQAANAQFGIDRTEPPPAIMRNLGPEHDLIESSARILAGTAQALWKLSTEFKGALAGHLYLTSYRVYFATRGINLHSGSYSIFLNTIATDQYDKGWISDQLKVQTRTAKYFFALRHGKEFAYALEEAAGRPAQLGTLRELLLARFDNVMRDIPGITAAQPDATTAIAVCERAARENKLNILQLSAIANAIELLHD